MNPTWTLLRLNPQHQPRFVDHIAENLPEVEYYFPKYPKLTRPHRCRHPITLHLPVYPGYIFARFDPNNGGVHKLISTPVRAHFIKFGGKISIVPDPVILNLREKERLNQLMQERLIQDPYYPGRRVRVHLPIADIEGVILQIIGRNRVLVDTNIGRATMHRHQIAIA